MDKLVISDDQGHTTVVPLLHDEVTIGREKGNTIRLTERNVSRTHARLVKRNGHYIVEDLGSYNGVSLNGERIDQRAEVNAGDELTIGDYALAIQLDLPEAVSSTVPAPEPRSHPPPRLVVLGEPAAGAEFTLNKPALRIGRDEQLDIWINHKSISHEHAEVQVFGNTVTLFDLDSANGTRVNGVLTSRAVLEMGDVVQLGQVRFRFLPAEGAHSLVPPSEEAPDAAAPSPVTPNKPTVALLVVTALVAAVAGAVLVTMRGAPGFEVPDVDLSGMSPGRPVESKAGTQETTRRAASSPTPAPPTRQAREAQPNDEPQEWERELNRARRALARGRFDRAYAIAQELPADSVLRDTPEFGEIRYRYVQSHINDGEEALQEGDAARAADEAAIALDVKGITPRQRQEARRLLRRAKSK